MNKDIAFDVAVFALTVTLIEVFCGLQHTSVIVGSASTTTAYLILRLMK